MNHYTTLLFFAALLSLLSGCAGVPPVCEGCSDPWSASGYNSLFDKPGRQGYAAYAASKKAMLRQAKHFPLWLDAEERAVIVTRIAPRRHTPSPAACPATKERAVILIHGLFDTPYIMRDLADYLNGLCYTVYDVLLAGHGSRPGDLLTISREEWKREVEYVVRQVQMEHSELYIGGFSLGGALSLYAAQRYDAIKGVLLFAPALVPSSRAAYLSVPVTVFNGRYFRVFGEYDYAKYESLSHRGGAETYLLGNEVKGYLKEGFDKPLFLAVSLEDDTIDAAYTVHRTVANKANRTVIFAADTDRADALCNDYNRRNGRGACRVVPSAVREEGIQSLSHVGLVVTPHNEHYGVNGDYRNCLYAAAGMRLCLEGEVTRQSCEKEVLCYGETVVQSKKPIIRRITFNPHFDTLSGELGGFLKQLEGRGNGE